MSDYSINTYSISYIEFPVLVGAVATLCFFLTGRKHLTGGWHLLPRTGADWAVLWFHTLESLVVCLTIAFVFRAGAIAEYLLFSCALVLLISAGAAPHNLRSFRYRGCLLLAIILIGALLPVANR